MEAMQGPEMFAADTWNAVCVHVNTCIFGQGQRFIVRSPSAGMRLLCRWDGRIRKVDDVADCSPSLSASVIELFVCSMQLPGPCTSIGAPCAGGNQEGKLNCLKGGIACILCSTRMAHTTMQVIDMLLQFCNRGMQVCTRICSTK
jgi:hypothetical protein